MLVNDKQKEFLRLRIIEGQAMEVISKEIDVPVDTLYEWSVLLIEQIEELKLNEIDKITADFQLGMMKRLRSLGEMYAKLQAELNKRDFSGLPTDKLYYILTDVRDTFDALREEDQYWDDSDDFEDWEE